jgi:hypothetical protein
MAFLPSSILLLLPYLIHSSTEITPMARMIREFQPVTSTEDLVRMLVLLLEDLESNSVHVESRSPDTGWLELELDEFEPEGDESNMVRLQVINCELIHERRRQGLKEYWLTEEEAAMIERTRSERGRRRIIQGRQGSD